MGLFTSKYASIISFETVSDLKSFIMKESWLKSFFLKDSFGVIDRQVKLEQLIDQLDQGVVSQLTFSMFLDRVAETKPEFLKECEQLKKEHLYGFYIVQCGESTAGLALNEDANTKQDQTSKFSYVNLKTIPENILEVMSSFPEWEFYNSANQLAGEIVDCHHQYVHEILTVLAEKFGFSTELSQTGFFRSLNYIPGTTGRAMSPHYDMTFMTILSQSTGSCDALQVRENGSWETVHFPQGYILIQFGYLAQLISNGFIVPMYHGVGPVSSKRNVCVYFTSLDPDTKLSYSSPLEHGEMSKEEAWKFECGQGNKYSQAFTSLDETFTVRQYDVMVNNILLKQ